MQKFKTIGDAIALAEFAHRNQVDKAGLPYIEHPRRVLEKVKAQGALPYVQMAAILHDVTEDTAFTPEMLLNLGVPESAVEIVRLVDRNLSREKYLGKMKAGEAALDSWSGLYPNELAIAVDKWNFNTFGSVVIPTPEEFYYQEIRKNSGAKMVKLADIEDNLSPWRLAYLADDTQTRLKDKYARAIALLT